MWGYETLVWLGIHRKDFLDHAWCIVRIKLNDRLTARDRALSIMIQSHVRLSHTPAVHVLGGILLDLVRLDITTSIPPYRNTQRDGIDSLDTLGILLESLQSFAGRTRSTGPRLSLRQDYLPLWERSRHSLPDEVSY